MLHAHGCSGLIQPGTVGVAEPMEPDPATSQLETYRDKVVGSNRVGVIGLPGHCTREEPSSLGLETERLPLLQFMNEAPLERDLVLRVFGLQFVESLADRRPLDQNHRTLEVEVRPPPA